MKKVVAKGPSSMKGQSGKKHKAVMGPSVVKGQKSSAMGTKVPAKKPAAVAATPVKKGVSTTPKQFNQGYSKLESVSMGKMTGPSVATKKK